MPETEADTCRMYVLPKLYGAGWTDEQINEQHTFTDGRVIPTAKRVRRGPQKRADYRLRYTRDFPIAIVEAKASYKTAGEGLQQAKEYAEILDLKFAYATNGTEIIEFDFLTGLERPVSTFPSPDELWCRLAPGAATGGRQGGRATAHALLPPAREAPSLLPGQSPSTGSWKPCSKGRRRVLLTMATGTGKTLVAFQICWKLWNAVWNRTGEHRRPKILYLADRNILIDDPKDKDFAPFGDARWKITNGKISQGREIYFAIYQAIAEDENRPGLYREYPPDFFDLIIVDECHRGSARDESSWREILEYFEPAYQLGLDGHAQVRREREHLRLLRQPRLHLQPAAGHRRRLPGPVPRPPDRDHLRRPGLAAEQGRTRPLRARDSRRRVPDQGFRAGRGAAGPHQGHRPQHHRLPEADGPLRQDHRVLRRSGTRRRNAAAVEQPERRSGPAVPQLRLPGDGRRGRHRARPPEQLSGRGQERRP